MLEYVFFHERPRQQFIEFLEQLGLSPQLLASDESLLVALDESSVDDALADTIESSYDEMMELDQALFSDSVPSGQEDFQTAGVVINLADGQTVYADVDSDLLKRVMEVLTPEEVGDLVNAIVDAVEHPDQRPLCKRTRRER